MSMALIELDKPKRPSEPPQPGDPPGAENDVDGNDAELVGGRDFLITDYPPEEELEDGEDDS